MYYKRSELFLHLCILFRKGAKNQREGFEKRFNDKGFYDICLVLPRRQKKNPVDFDDELKIGDVSDDNMT